jgi:predicted nucleotide-binding protein (sugar kinase/HSP70/actin superfamily)
MDANQANIGAEIKTIRENIKEDMKAQVSSFAFLMDANQEKMKEKFKSGQKEMISTASAIQGKMEAAIHSIRSELEKIIKHRVEDVLSCVDQKKQGLRKK